MADDLPLSADFPPGDEAQWRALAEKALEGAPLSNADHADRARRAGEAALSRRRTGRRMHPACPAPRHSSAAAVRRNEQFLPWDIRQIVAHPGPGDRSRPGDGGAGRRRVVDRAAGRRRGRAWRRRALGGRHREDPEGREAGLGAGWPGGGRRAPRRRASNWRPCWRRRVDARAAASALIAFNVDPIGALARTGALPGPAEEEIAQAASFARDVGRRISEGDRPARRLAAGARGRRHRSAGTRLPCRQRRRVCARADDGRAERRHACRAILFTCSVGADYQVEMAKLRAARRMWGRVAEAFGANGPAAGMKLQAVTSRRMLTRRDPWVNILRNTAACFAAGVGGADIVTVRTLHRRDGTARQAGAAPGAQHAGDRAGRVEPRQGDRCAGRSVGDRKARR